ncbi:M28 family metallopeptidase [soil metagenome]
MALRNFRARHGLRSLILCVGLTAALTPGARAQRSGEPESKDDAAPIVHGKPTPEAWVGIVDGKDVEVKRGTMGDAATLDRIMREGTTNSHVMDHLTHLTQQIGPRLTGSEHARRANEWELAQFKSWGLSNAQLDEWGTVSMAFDRGPSSGKVMMADPPRQQRRPGVTGADDPSPVPQPKLRSVRDMEVTTLSWTRGTDGPVRGEVIKLPIAHAELDKVKDRLKGAWILLPSAQARGMRDIRSRVSDQYEQRREVREKVRKNPDAELTIFEEVSLEPVAGYISSSRDERVWTGSVKGWRDLTEATIPPEVHVQVRLSDYDYLNSRLADNEKVYAEFDLKHEFLAGPRPAYNVIAEIPGTEKPDEVVFISAHTDSWDGPGSQGATDNGTGTSVTLEAARILMAAHAQPKRTIRFALWTGEEQGLLGSASYVKRHESEWPNWDACFVDDGGTGYEGGLGASTDEMVQMLAAATAPINGVFKDSTDNSPLYVNIKRIKSLRGGTAAGGSDHASFNKVGVPGFFWDEGSIKVGDKERVDYGYGWHTQNDKLALAVPEYLQQSALCAAVTAYRLACADTMLPRDPKPEPKKEDADSKDGKDVKPDAGKPVEAKPGEMKPVDPKADAPTKP